MIETGITRNNRLTLKMKVRWGTEVVPDTGHEDFLYIEECYFLMLRSLVKNLKGSNHAQKFWQRARKLHEYVGQSAKTIDV